MTSFLVRCFPVKGRDRTPRPTSDAACPHSRSLPRTQTKPRCRTEAFVLFCLVVFFSQLVQRRDEQALESIAEIPPPPLPQLKRERDMSMGINERNSSLKRQKKLRGTIASSRPSLHLKCSCGARDARPQQGKHVKAERRAGASRRPAHDSARLGCLFPPTPLI